MHLKEHIKRILKGSGKPLTVDEITSILISEGLFKFKAASPRGVVSSTLKRNAEGVHSCSPVKEKAFICVSENTYELIGSG